MKVELSKEDIFILLISATEAINNRDESNVIELSGVAKEMKHRQTKIINKLKGFLFTEGVK